MKECSFESRHLGLVTAEEITDIKDKLNRLAGAAEQCMDLDALLELAGKSEPLEYEPLTIPRKESVRIGVALDRAFCFYYRDNLELLTEMGAQLCYFSPLADKKLPKCDALYLGGGYPELYLSALSENKSMRDDVKRAIQLCYFSPLADKKLPKCDALYLGGGYPELYLSALSENKSMRDDVKRAIASGLPCIAECGGYMYLTEEIEGFPMVGALPGRCENKGRLVRFGYVTLTAQKDNLFCRAGETISAHEFHHYDVSEAGDAFLARKSGGASWECVCGNGSLYAGYPHLPFYANPDFAEHFYDRAIAFRKDKEPAAVL